MKIAVIGGGAMGSVWAVHLSKSGNDVTIVDVAQPLLDAVNTNGLKLVAGPRAEAEVKQQARVRATSHPEEIGIVDLAFCFVKAQHTASAAALARPLIGAATTVVSLQNGWGNADVLAQTYDPEQIVVGVTYHSATNVLPGLVAHTGRGPTFLGPYSDGSSMQRTMQVNDVLTTAGIEGVPNEQVKTEIWKKLILNSATLPTAALSGLRTGELGQPGLMLDLVDAVTDEAVRVAQALGYAIDYAERAERIHTILANGGAGKPSMLQDAEARRKTEIEVINGAVVSAAERVGIEVPINRTLVALINGLERSWQR